METTNLDRQFIGQARLARLLLWKVGDSTDIDVCLDEALGCGMLGEDDVSFLVECMSAEEAARDGAPIPMDVDQESIVRLRRCVDKLNRADCA